MIYIVSITYYIYGIISYSSMANSINKPSPTCFRAGYARHRTKRWSWKPG